MRFNFLHSVVKTWPTGETKVALEARKIILYQVWGKCETFLKVIFFQTWNNINVFWAIGCVSLP